MHDNDSLRDRISETSFINYQKNEEDIRKDIEIENIDAEQAEISELLAKAREENNEELAHELRQRQKELKKKRKSM